MLVGHSLGGGLVAGTAGYMVDNCTVDRLAGMSCWMVSARTARWRRAGEGAGRYSDYQFAAP